MKGYDSIMKWAILKSPYLSKTLWLQEYKLNFLILYIPKYLAHDSQGDFSIICWDN